MTAPSLQYEQSFGKRVAGIDEAGRGPWAGPVVASAVVLDYKNLPDGLNDSKKITAKKRQQLFAEIQRYAQVGIGIATSGEIDEINILQATFLAMQRALAQLNVAPDIALVDGNHAPKLPCAVKPIIGGDGLCPSIAAASIIAKVTRDSMMAKFAQQYPHYGWEHNAGYGTAAHQKGLAEHGVTPYHRFSFKPIQKYAHANQAKTAAAKTTDLA